MSVSSPQAACCRRSAVTASDVPQLTASWWPQPQQHETCCYPVVNSLWALLSACCTVAVMQQAAQTRQVAAQSGSISSVVAY